MVKVATTSLQNYPKETTLYLFNFEKKRHGVLAKQRNKSRQPLVANILNAWLWKIEGNRWSLPSQEATRPFYNSRQKRETILPPRSDSWDASHEARRRGVINRTTEGGDRGVKSSETRRGQRRKADGGGISEFSKVPRDWPSRDS